jgi:hypothetical protein
MMNANFARELKKKMIDRRKKVDGEDKVRYNQFDKQSGNFI